MKKKIYAAILLSGVIFLNGCGPKTITEYPSSVVSTTSESKKNETPTHVSRTLTDNDGKITFTLEADVIGSVTDVMPVYEVQKKSFSGEELDSLCKKFFENGTVNYIIPYSIADMEYLTNRLAEVEEKKKFYTDAGKEIPFTVLAEEENLKSAADNFNETTVTIKIPETPDWIDMADYYKKVAPDFEDSLRFFAAEGILGDDYWLFEAVETRDNLIIRMYKDYSGERISYESDENYPIYTGIESWVSEDEAVNFATKFMAMSGLEGFDVNTVDPIKISRVEVCDEDEANVPTIIYDEEHAGFCGSVKVAEQNYYGYQVAFSRLYNNSMQMYDAYSDYITINASSKNTPSFWDAPFIWEDTSLVMPDTYEMPAGSCYESVSMAVDEEGVFSFMWSSPMEVKELKTDKAVMLEFDKVMDRAETAFGMLSSRTFEAYGTNDKSIIKSIELKMARVQNGGKYTMVPAWYFVSDGLYSFLRKETRVCINAIDGSIIKVNKGGILAEE